MFLVGNQREYLILILHSIRLSEYRIGIKFNKDPLAVEQNSYLTKIVNVYIVYELNDWPRNLTNNFKFKNCLFEVTSIVKNSDIIHQK